MKKVFIWWGLAICACSLALGAFAVSSATRNTGASRLVLNEFLADAQRHDYHSAHRLCSNRLQEILGVDALRERWKPFEQTNGSIQKWLPMEGASGAGVSILPRWVDLTYHLKGSSGGTGFVVVRMVPEGETWRIEKLNVVP